MFCVRKSILSVLTRRVLSFCIVLVFVCSLCVNTTALAAIHPKDTEANALKELGIFKGREDGFALDQNLTRIEAAVILLRLLGKESEALAYDLPHPFDDVPAWAGAQIGYLYKYDLVKGITQTHFGNGPISFDQMMTLLLRALGYNDSAGDFLWSNASLKAVELSVLTPRRYAIITEEPSFTREDLVTCVFGVLSAVGKGARTTLIRRLLNDAVLSEQQIQSTGCIELLEAAGLLTPLSRHIVLNQKFEINPVSPDSQITLTVSLADNYQNRQRVISHRFSHTPESVYYVDGSLFAVFSLKNFTVHTTIEIETELEIYRYDYTTAQKVYFPMQLSEQDRKRYVSSTNWIESDDPAFRSVTFGNENDSDFQKLQAIKNYVLTHMKIEITKDDVSALTALKRGAGDCFDYSIVLAAFCRANDIPARIIIGVMPRDGLPGHAYCEVFLQDFGWVPFDLVNTATGYVTFEQLKNEFVYLASVSHSGGNMGYSDYFYGYGLNCTYDYVETCRELEK